MNLDGILNFMLNNYIYFVIVAIIFVLTSSSGLSEIIIPFCFNFNWLFC